MGDALPRSVAALLAASQYQHMTARTCRLKHDLPGHLKAIAEAWTLRTEADALDPEHHDGAWAAEVAKRFHHHDLLHFYQAEIARAGASVPDVDPVELRARIGVPDGMAVEDSMAFRSCLPRVEA